MSTDDFMIFYESLVWSYKLLYDHKACFGFAHAANFANFDAVSQSVSPSVSPSVSQSASNWGMLNRIVLDRTRWLESF